MTAPMTATAPALAVIGLSKRFGASVALQDVDLAIAPGEVHAVLGENGSGKSTLIKILSGFHRPDAGTVALSGELLPFGHPGSSYRLGARFVHQDLGLVDSIPVLDNLAIGAGYATRMGTISARRSRARARADLARVGLAVDPGASVGSLSPATRTGVAIARALREDADSPVRLLVLDEPTATLPATEVDRLMEIIRRVSAAGVGVLYVTHRLDEVFSIAGNVTVLRDGREVATVPTSSLDHHRLVDLLVGEELATAHQVAETLSAEGERPALSLRGLAAASLEDFSADIRAGQITGIAGITGSGRETVLGAVFGAIGRTGEVITTGGVLVPPSRPDLAMRHGLAYLPADRVRNAAILSLSARENIALSRLRPFRRFGTMRRGPERRTVLSWFERLGVRPAGLVDLPLESFSGGNQQKIMFAKWLRREPGVFLLDEPTQGVDVGAKAVLHQQLMAAAAAGAAIVVSSSDVDELAAICQRVIVCRAGRAAADLRGGEVSARPSAGSACWAVPPRPVPPRQCHPDQYVPGRGCPGRGKNGGHVRVSGQRLSFGFDRFSGLYLWALFILIFGIWEPHLFLSLGHRPRRSPRSRPWRRSSGWPWLSRSRPARSTSSIGATAQPQCRGGRVYSCRSSTGRCGRHRGRAPHRGAHRDAQRLHHRAAAGERLHRDARHGHHRRRGRDHRQREQPAAAADLHRLGRPHPVPDLRIPGHLLLRHHHRADQLVVPGADAGRPVHVRDGGNSVAARLSGVRVGGWTWLSLIFSGTVAGLAGVLYASQSGPSLTFGAVAPAARLRGRVPRLHPAAPGPVQLWGTVLAVYVLATGVYGVQLITSVQWLNDMFNGVALIVAVSFAVWRQRRAREGVTPAQPSESAGAGADGGPPGDAPPAPDGGPPPGLRGAPAGGGAAPGGGP